MAVETNALPSDSSRDLLIPQLGGQLTSVGGYILDHPKKGTLKSLNHLVLG